MASFGQRIGQRPINDIIQTDSVDSATRVGIWNWMSNFMRGLVETRHTKAVPFARTIWADLMLRPIDEYFWSSMEQDLKHRVLRDDWVDTLEAVEGFGSALDAVLGVGFGNQYRKAVNELLSRGLIGYRFLGPELARVDDDQSAAEISEALTTATDAARSHLRRAASLLSDRENPQYGKVAGEAVLAVEASVYSLTGKKTLGEGMKELGKRGLPVHPAVVKAWSAMYGYTSDAGGMRHANIGGEEIDAAMAVYLFATCSAFVNLLTKVASKAASNSAE